MNGHRAFANGGRDTLHRCAPHIPSHEHTRHAGFERQWFTLEWPARGTASVPQLGSGDNESAIVARDAFTHPVGMRMRSNEDEQEVRGHLALGSKRTVCDRNCLEVFLAGS